MEKGADKDETKAVAVKAPHRLRDTIITCILLVAWVFVAVIASQYAIFYALFYTLGRDWLLSPVGNASYSALVYVLALILVILVPRFVFKKQGKTNREEIGLTGWPTWTDLGLAAVGYVAAIILSMIFTSIFSLFPWFNATETQNVGFSIFMNAPDRVIAFVTLVVVAPIAEEIIFRGWLYGKLRAKIPMPIAILLVSLLFGLVHGQWNVGITVFAMSIILCLIREFTGTIYGGIVMHMIKNAIAFVLLYIFGVH